MASLSVLAPTSYNSESGTAWVSTTVGDIDELIASADGAYIQSGVNATGYILYDIPDMPTNFSQMVSLKANVRYNLLSRIDDSERLYISIVKSDGVSILAYEVQVASSPTTGWKNSGELTLTLIAGTTKTDWDGGLIKLRTLHSGSVADNSYWEIDCVNLSSGIYESTPTISLVDPANSGYSSGLTPPLTFVGTDDNGIELEYYVEVDTVNTFDTQSSTAISQTTVNQNNAIYGDTYGNWGERGTQSFKLVSPARIESVVLKIKKVGTPTDALQVWISTSQGGSAISGLTASNLDGTSITTSYVDYTFTFSTPTELVPGVTYWIVIARTIVGSDAVNYYHLNGTNTGNYTGGAFYLRAGVNWAQWGNDIYFKVNVKKAWISKDSTTDAGFSGSPDNTHPFAQGQNVTYTVATSLTADQTYYWRVYGKDVSVWNISTSTWSFIAARSLAIQNLAQVQSIEKPSLTQFHVLNIANLDQIQLTSIPLDLEIQDTSQGQLLEAISIIVNCVLVIQNIAENQSIDSTLLEQIYTLTIDAILQSQQIDNCDVSIIGMRIYGPALQAA